MILRCELKFEILHNQTKSENQMKSGSLKRHSFEGTHVFF